ncbi:MAG: hypothetical protein JWP94_2944 [Mucilaginibacter sp.]|nr:hypothetical protein [Mucilaginibacter sp.]
MKLIGQFIKFLIFCIIVAAEFTLKMLLEIVTQMKKAFQ